jgi:ureidoglycolate lyase
MIPLNLGRNTLVSFSTCRVSPSPWVITVMEYHTFCQEGILPLDGAILLALAPATANEDLPWDRIEVFRIPQGTLVMLRSGVWHGGPFADQADPVNVLITLPERTYANDCHVTAIPVVRQSEIG